MIIKRIFFVLCIVVTSGCTTYSLKRQLKRQLSQGGKYEVIVQSYDSANKTAYLKIIDKTKFTDLQGAKTFYHYRHNGREWVQYDPNIATDNTRSQE